MLVVALNVGALFFSSVPSLNDYVFEPFDWKKYLSLLFLLKQTWCQFVIYEGIDMLKKHFSMENMKLIYV